MNTNWVTTDIWLVLNWSGEFDRTRIGTLRSYSPSCSNQILFPNCQILVTSSNVIVWCIADVWMICFCLSANSYFCYVTCSSWWCNICVIKHIIITYVTHVGTARFFRVRVFCCIVLKITRNGKTLYLLFYVYHILHF